MKRTTILLIVLMMTLAVMAQRMRVIDNPVATHNERDTILTVTRIELSDTSTILHCRVKYQSNEWIRIAKRSSLLDDDGRRYRIKDGYGIKIAKQTYMPKSGVLTFQLAFEPLPINTRFIDFIEGPSDWKIWGLHEKGATLPRRDFERVMEERVLKQDGLEDFFRKGCVVVRGKFDKTKSKVMTYYNCDPIRGKHDYMAFSIDDNGAFEVKIPVDHPTFGVLNCTGLDLYFYGEAGDTVEVDINDWVATYSEKTPCRKMLTLLTNDNPLLALRHEDTWKRIKNTYLAEYSAWVYKEHETIQSLIGYLSDKYMLSPEETHIMQTTARVSHARSMLKYLWQTRTGNARKEILDVQNYYALPAILGPDDFSWLIPVQDAYNLIVDYSSFGPMRQQVIKSNHEDGFVVTGATDMSQLKWDMQLFKSGKASLLLQLCWLKDSHSPNISDNGQNIKALYNRMMDSRKKYFTYPYLLTLADELKREMNAEKGATVEIPQLGRGTELVNEILDEYPGKYVYLDIRTVRWGNAYIDIENKPKLFDSINSRPDMKYVFIMPEEFKNDTTIFAKFINARAGKVDCRYLSLDDCMLMRGVFMNVNLNAKYIITPERRIVNRYTFSGYIQYPNMDAFLEEFNAVKNAVENEGKQ